MVVNIDSRRSRLGLEQLDDRCNPATLVIDSIELTDSAGGIIDQNIVPLWSGEQMFFNINYTVNDLPSDAEYGISVTIDGITVTASGITSGAGGGAADSKFTVNTNTLFGGNTWYARPGFNGVFVSIFAEAGFNDSDSDYEDFEAFMPDPVFLPFRLARPITGTQGKTFVIVNTIDYDPNVSVFGNDGIVDINGGRYTTDGQTATEFQLADYSVADTGVQVLAAAAGRVIDVFDGEYDRNYDLTSPDQLANVDYGNYVVIDHDDGWFTRYYGFRTNSIRVGIGDKVSAGTILGQVGGSGIPALGARLGFQFEYDRGGGAFSIIDPFADSYWAAAPTYQGKAPVSLNSGVTNYNFANDSNASGPAERPTRVDNFAPGQTVYFWSTGSHNVGSKGLVQWFDPNGNLAAKNEFTLSKAFQRSSATFTLPSSATNGSWRVTYTVGATQVASVNFNVLANPSTPTLYARATQPASPPSGEFYLVSGRMTPLNLGTWTLGTTTPRAALKFTNIGSAPLTLGTPLTTSGFKFFDFPTADIAPGQTVEFSIGFSGTVTGSITGQFRIPTNDPNLPFFDGTVQGISREAGAGDSGGSGSTGVPINIFNNPLVGTAQGIRTTAAILTPGLAPGAKAPVPDNSYAVSTDAGGSVSQVVLYSSDGSERYRMEPFPGFNGGIRSAVADFNGDGVSDLIVGTGPGTTTLVRIFNGRTSRLMFELQPFESTFTGGVFVAAGDLNQDGIPDLVITPDQGGGPRVRIFDGSFAAEGRFGVLADFFGIDDPNFRGGARAAVGDINGDGRPDLVVAAGFGGGPRVAVFNGQTLLSLSRTRLMGDFLAFENTLRNGVFVAVGDINGDGKGDLIVGSGPGGGPRVVVFSGDDLLQNRRTELANFFAGDPAQRGGVRVAVRDLFGNGQQDLVTGSGTGGSSQLLTYPLSQLTQAQPRAELNRIVFRDFNGGIFVG